MTKFDGESVATRSGRHASSISAKDRRKNMERFLQTGQHPQIEHAKQQLDGAVIAALPPIDINRPHVFIDLMQASRELGRVVIELFEDVVPTAAQQFKTRCLEGHHTLKGTTLHKVLPHFAVHGGINSNQKATATPPTGGRSTRLQHVDPGIVSTSRDGTEFAITLGRALQLDSTHQIIGRVGRGMDIIESLNHINTDVDAAPLRPIKIAQCGTTDHRGAFERLSAVNDEPTTAEDAIQRIKGEFSGTQANLADALQQGLKRKPQNPEQHKRKKVHIEALPEVSSDSDDSDA